MKLTRIDVQGFGCLRDFRADLADGLNVFYGMNEAGKSTLQQAVRALLYGFYDADRARPEETARHARFRPWEGGLYRGSLEYKMEDGRRFEVRRDFTTADVDTQLIDLFTGDDVSSQYGRGRHGNIPFARRHLGMSRTVFQSCAFISQGEIFHVAENGPKEIADAIAALADTAGRDVSAAKAIDRLKAALQRIGSDRARTAELPKARDELAAAEAELRAVDEARRALSERAAALDSLQNELRDLEERIERAEYGFAVARAAELTGRLKSLDEAEEMFRQASVRCDELEGYARFPSELRDDLLSMKARWERAREAVDATRDALAEAGEAVPSSERLEFETLRASAGSLDRDQVAALEAIAYGKVRAWPLRIAAAIGRAVARVARGAWWLVTRRPPSEPAEKAPPPLCVSREEALGLLDAYRRYLTLAPAVERLRELQRRLDSEEAELAAARSRLLAVLDSVLVRDNPEDSDIEAAVEAFLSGCRNRAAYEAALAVRGEAAKRRDLLLGDISRDQLEAEKRRCEERAATMRGANAGIDEGHPRGRSRDLAQQWQALRDERSELELKAEALRQEVQITMSHHRPRAEVEEEVARGRKRVAELESAREAARTAVATIEEAMVSVYRDFAPAVNSFLSEGVELVTDGRYTRAHVDPRTLSISLLVPETGLVMQDPPVSHGTRTLAYVLMRIGLAQHMSSVGEPVPLILDDPFVDVDAERLPRILEYLDSLSDRIQVLLFTKDESIVNWCGDDNHAGRRRVHDMVFTAEAGAAL